MKLSIIIVSYNVKEFIKQCIRSVYNSDFNSKDIEIIVIDNDSHDGSVKCIKDNFPEILIHENDRNEGFSKAVNKGLDMATGEYICLINPDVIVSKNTFTILMNSLEMNDNIGCIGPKILNVNGSIQHSCKRSFPTPLNAISRLLYLDRLFPKSKIFGKYNLTYLNENKIQNVDAISGAFMMFRKSLYNKIGSFDERFFMFGEDIDYCYRIKEAKLSVVYNPKSEILHYKGESVKNAPYDMVNIFYSAMNIYFDKYTSKNKHWYLIKYFMKVGLFIRKGISYVRLLLNNILPLFIDVFFIISSFSLSIYIWYTLTHDVSVNLFKIFTHWPLIINFLLSWFISSRITHTYKQKYLAYTRLSITMLATFLISSTTTYFISVFAFSRGVLVLSTIFSLFFILSWRYIINFLFQRNALNIKSFRNLFERRVAVIGVDKQTISLVEEIAKSPYTNINIVGFIDYDNNNDNTSNDLFLGKIKYIKEVIKKNKISEIIIRENYLDSNNFFNVVKLLKGSNVIIKIIPKERNIIISKGEIEQISDIELISFKASYLDHNKILFKRLFDIISSLLILILFVPIFLFIFFFKGVNKFKVWGVSANKVDLYYFKVNSPFISSLPMLINILKGDISFVGSNITSCNNKNTNQILIPGLVSLLDIKMFKNKDKDKVNSYYMQNQSLTFDIEILLKSIFGA